MMKMEIFTNNGTLALDKDIIDFEFNMEDLEEADLASNMYSASYNIVVCRDNLGIEKSNKFRVGIYGNSKWYFYGTVQTVNEDEDSTTIRGSLNTEEILTGLIEGQYQINKDDMSMADLMQMLGISQSNISKQMGLARSKAKFTITKNTAMYILNQLCGFTNARIGVGPRFRTSQSSADENEPNNKLFMYGQDGIGINYIPNTYKLLKKNKASLQGAINEVIVYSLIDGLDKISQTQLKINATSNLGFIRNRNERIFAIAERKSDNSVIVHYIGGHSVQLQRITSYPSQVLAVFKDEIWISERTGSSYEYAIYNTLGEKIGTHDEVASIGAPSASYQGYKWDCYVRNGVKLCAALGGNGSNATILMRMVNSRLTYVTAEFNEGGTGWLQAPMLAFDEDSEYLNVYGFAVTKTGGYCGLVGVAIIKDGLNYQYALTENLGTQSAFDRTISFISCGGLSEKGGSQIAGIIIQDDTALILSGNQNSSISLTPSSKPLQHDVYYSENLFPCLVDVDGGKIRARLVMNGQYQQIFLADVTLASVFVPNDYTIVNCIEGVYFVDLSSSGEGSGEVYGGMTTNPPHFLRRDGKKKSWKYEKDSTWFNMPSIDRSLENKVKDLSVDGAVFNLSYPQSDTKSYKEAWEFVYITETLDDLFFPGETSYNLITGGLGTFIKTNVKYDGNLIVTYKVIGGPLTYGKWTPGLYIGG